MDFDYFEISECDNLFSDFPTGLCIWEEPDRYAVWAAPDFSDLMPFCGSDFL